MNKNGNRCYRTQSPILSFAGSLARSLLALAAAAQQALQKDRRLQAPEEESEVVAGALARAHEAGRVAAERGL